LIIDVSTGDVVVSDELIQSGLISNASTHGVTVSDGQCNSSCGGA
jgi:hypothetical protein